MARSDYPPDDGWTWLYRLYDQHIAQRDWLRRPLCAYLNPTPIERFGSGRIFRLLGVDRFGKVIPTGGVMIRRLAGTRMAPYTLAGNSIRAARDFRYRTCVFELAHMPFLLALLALAIYRITTGEYRLALEDTLINLAVNVYPVLHHRHTRLRIDNLLAKAGRPTPADRLKPLMSTPA